MLVGFFFLFVCLFGLFVWFFFFFFGLFVFCCWTSLPHASVSQGRICSDSCTWCHTEIEVADQAFYLTQSQCTDTGPTSPGADPLTPGAWQDNHWSANAQITGMTGPGNSPRRERESNPGSSALVADALTTRPTRRSNCTSREREIRNRSPLSTAEIYWWPDTFLSKYIQLSFLPSIK